MDQLIIRTISLGIYVLKTTSLEIILIHSLIRTKHFHSEQIPLSRGISSINITLIFVSGEVYSKIHALVIIWMY